MTASSSLAAGGRSNSASTVSIVGWSVGLTALTVLLPGPTVALVVWILPVLLLRILSGERRSHRSLAALFFLLAAVVHPLHLIWEAQGGWEKCVELTLDPMVLATGWVAVGASWFIAEGSELAQRLTALLKRSKHRRLLVQRAEALRAEWGFEETSSAGEKERPRPVAESK
ncbi:hypothetical protein Amme_072_013 [Acidomonas methanolica NBRC 104435]|uniref:Uncharacterized protein n=1 Tax=Acidomonas methanolica NBRC 104435 TaxID=1231351 RepID=A0A023D6B4_ACIMT|nr:hypothetical protein EDC31_13215 [Acidomonas methanolica]GAJ29644.1 hypothetical protein Amme_072_013 [Acidomonas methanolica NBRC 104435]GEL00322.1 hypothetical protein AME01nite_28200 [Acidomonas methanolica NBRC 104435]